MLYIKALFFLHHINEDGTCVSVPYAGMKERKTEKKRKKSRGLVVSYPQFVEDL